MTERTAVDKVYEFLDLKGYKDERVIWHTESRENVIWVEMIKPYGLFIVNKCDGSVEDNYETFERKEK